jgi:copper chaperone CopZ
LTCGHCVKAVTEEVGAIPGVSAVEVELVPEGVSSISVVSEAPLDRGAVAAAVEEAGYELIP